MVNIAIHQASTSFHIAQTVVIGIIRLIRTACVQRLRYNLPLDTSTFVAPLIVSFTDFFPAVSFWRTD